MDGKNYTVMELAEKIGVPRTTINDWLGRYCQYIDTVVQGKRKVYPESALNVLREIATLRNSGKGFADIETELSAKHPIHAVPIPPQEKTDEIPEKPQEGIAPDPDRTGGNDGFAVIARQQSEEIGRLIGESFRNMDQRIQGLETLSAAQQKMFYFRLVICILFLLILAGSSFLAWRAIDIARKENIRLQHRQIENTVKLTELKEQSIRLIAGSKAFQANIARLESELKQQKKDFEQNIKAENRRLTELHQAKEKALLSERDQARMKIQESETRLALEKEKFAAERLKLLKEIEELKKQQEQRTAETARKSLPQPKPQPEQKKKPEIPPGSASKQKTGETPAKPDRNESGPKTMKPTVTPDGVHPEKP